MKNKLRFIIGFITFLLTIINLTAQTLYPEEKQMFDRLLEDNGIDSTSVNFLKDWASDTKYKLPTIVNIINNPFEFPKLCDNFQQIVSQNSSTDYIKFSANILLDKEVLWEDNQADFTKKVELIQKPEDIFEYIQYVWQLADKHYNKVYKDLAIEEKEQIEYFILSLYAETQDSLIYKKYYKDNKIVEFENLEIEKIIPIIEKINFPEMMQVANIQQTGFDILIEFLENSNISWNDIYIENTPWGKMIIGTNIDDIYYENYCFILDPDGDETYKGEISTNFNYPYYWIIDLAGNDRYLNQNLRGMLANAPGFGFGYDADGNDLYQGGDFSLSSFFGYNYHLDYCGNDTYSLGMHSAGAATFGLAILQDERGDDIYSVSQFGQGFGGTLGIGLLNDLSGDDLFFAGGKYLHEPLAPYDYRSLSQGFGYGFRPDLGGGIGILRDNIGNDRYDGGVFAQGVGYWYALGILLDNSGNDFYNAVYYPQGSGIHLAGGFLFDGDGEDSYYSKHGPGQGAGHDYGVGFLIDRKGDDCYSVEGGNGLGLTNSVGIFLDARGNDRYERADEKSFGYANKARDSGGIGLFIDKGGKDYYALERCENESTWQAGKYGFGQDMNIENPLRAVQKEQKENISTIDSLDTIENIFEIAAGWGVGNNVTNVKTAAKILLFRDKETAEYISENKMKTKSSLTFRAISNYAKESIEFSGYFTELLANQDSLIVKNTISIIGVTADSSYFQNLEEFLNKNLYVTSVLSTLGKLKIDNSVEILAKYINSNNEKIRVITARGLKNIDSKLSHKYLRKMVDDRSFLIRTMLEDLEE